MSPRAAWYAAGASMLLGVALYGWRGGVLAATVVVFAALLQFGRALRAMRVSAQAPVGRVGSGAALAARLRSGMPLWKVVQAAGSLGEALSDRPDVWRWRDGDGAQVRVTFLHGRVATWSLERGGGLQPGSDRLPGRSRPPRRMPG